MIDIYLNFTVGITSLEASGFIKDECNPVRMMTIHAEIWFFGGVRVGRFSFIHAEILYTGQR